MCRSSGRHLGLRTFVAVEVQFKRPSAPDLRPTWYALLAPTGALLYPSHKLRRSHDYSSAANRSQMMVKIRADSASHNNK